MTYTTFIEKLRLRCYGLMEKHPAWQQVGFIFDIVNDAARELSMKAKDKQSSCSFSIVGGTASYTVSTIASDIDEIQLIVAANGLIEPRNLRQFNQEVPPLADPASNYLSIPAIFDVYNGTLKLSPTPATSETATLYYSPVIAVLAYSTANVALTIPLRDDYINVLLYECMAIMYEMAGDGKQAMYCKAVASEKFDEVKASQPHYGFNETIKYQGVVDETATFMIPMTKF